MKESKRIILASKSPRRKELLTLMGYDFVSISLDVDESYGEKLNGGEITEFLSLKKAHAYTPHENDILITADTIVWFENKAIEKPMDLEDAKRMLGAFSDNMHEVYSSITIKTKEDTFTFTDKALVYFKKLTSAQINYYVNTYQPLDKAGAYGIQEWLGLIGIEKIVGSFYTIMGLPTEKLYPYLVKLIGEPKRK